jgi:hypothetical protein
LNDKHTLTLITSFEDLKIPFCDYRSTNMPKRGLTYDGNADMLEDIGQQLVRRYNAYTARLSWTHSTSSAEDTTR